MPKLTTLGDEIKTALAAEADTNTVTDAQLAIFNAMPAESLLSLHNRLTAVESASTGGGVPLDLSTLGSGTQSKEEFEGLVDQLIYSDDGSGTVDDAIAIRVSDMHNLYMNIRVIDDVSGLFDVTQNIDATYAGLLVFQKDTKEYHSWDGFEFSLFGAATPPPASTIQAGTNQGSTYEEDVYIPVYDASNSEHLLVTVANGNFSQINNPAYKAFFVAPGDYGNTRINLTADGTSQDKRYIVLHNGDNLHPGKLANNAARAKVGFTLNNADYWVIDRMSFWDGAAGLRPIDMLGSSNNIINRYYLYDVADSITVNRGSDNNTFQRCRAENNDLNIHQDAPMFGITHGAQPYSNDVIANNKFLSSESANRVDFIQTVRQSPFGSTVLSYPGTIMDNNHAYIDDRFYTDGSGNHDVNGLYAYAENAFDLKVGSEDAGNPMIVSNNIGWGYRQSDGTNSSLSDSGVSNAMHFGLNNIIIEDNVMFDSNAGIFFSGKYNNITAKNTVVRRNIFDDIKGYAVFLSASDNVDFEDNLFKNIGQNGGQAMNFSSGEGANINGSFINNKVFNANGKQLAAGAPPATRTGNEYWNIGNNGLTATSGNDVIHGSDPTAGYTDFTFITDRYTNSPRTLTVQKVVAP